MAISLACLAGAANAQAPTGWANPGDTPARTTWQQFPDAVKALPTLPSAAATGKPVSVNPPVQPAPAGSRVILYSKPANDVVPVQATEPKAEKKADKKDDKKDEKKPTPSTEKDINPFRLINDADLAGEVAGAITKTNDDDYRVKIKEWETDKSKQKPPVPVPVKAGEVPVLLPAAAQMAVRTKPGYTPTLAALEPGYVVHRKLYFEEKNAERYGWDLGMVQPFLSTAYFYKDVLLWPSNLASSVHSRFDSSAGKCAPGSPVAYYLYPPELTVGGSLVGVGTIVGTALLFP